MDAEHLADLNRRTYALEVELNRLRVRLAECETYYSQLKHMITAARERTTPQPWSNQRAPQPEPWRHSNGNHMQRL
jgi:hypothetical protein